MRARVLKPVLFESLKSGYAKSLVSKLPKTIPCYVTGNPKEEPAKEGYCWIILKSPTVPTAMRVQVRQQYVLVRHRFLRPWFPLSELPRVKSLASDIERYSHLAEGLQQMYEDSVSVND